MIPLVNGIESAPESDVLTLATQVLSGKRAALVGFSNAVAEQMSGILTEAHAFARPFPLDVNPGADVLKPFELMLINVEAASGSHWLNPEELTGITDRSLALGSRAALLSLVTGHRFPYREFCVWPTAPGQLLFRCVLTLKSSSRAARRSGPQNSIVVFADDDPSITTLMCRTVQRSGMTCEVAVNGIEALEQVEKWKPCAAVLDVGMPGMDGFEVLSRIRSDVGLASTKVILLTGSEQEKDVLRGFSLGADDYVTKPFNPMEVLIRLKRAIGSI